jgi:hypothetical protein
MNAAGRSLRDECPALGSKISHRAAHLRETDCVAEDPVEIGPVSPIPVEFKNREID